MHSSFPITGESFRATFLSVVHRTICPAWNWRVLGDADLKCSFQLNEAKLYSHVFGTRICFVFFRCRMWRSHETLLRKFSSTPFHDFHVTALIRSSYYYTTKSISHAYHSSTQLSSRLSSSPVCGHSYFVVSHLDQYGVEWPSHSPICGTFLPFFLLTSYFILPFCYAASSLRTTTNWPRHTHTDICRVCHVIRLICGSVTTILHTTCLSGLGSPSSVTDLRVFTFRFMAS